MDTAGITQPSQLTGKGRATKNRIVRAAAALMYEHGVASTSTEEIRRAAGVSNSQLYHYFADKDELIRAVTADQIERVLAGQEELLDGLDSFAALETWRDTIVAIAARQSGRGGCPIGSLASELADLDEQARIALAGAFDRWEGAMRDGLTAMRERGELRQDTDTDRLAISLLIALQGGLLLTQTRRDSAPLQAGLDGAIDYVRKFAA